MKKTLCSFAALFLFGSFAATSGALASTNNDAQIVEDVDNKSLQPLGPTESTDVLESPRPPIGIVEELSPVWTRADCTKAWKMNMMGCNASPPNLRPACWAAASALFAACVAASKG